MRSPPADRMMIALDWGTTNLRATLLDPNGEPLAHRSAASGILQVSDSQFEPALLHLCGDWIDRHTTLLASGMIGSRQGWREAPYLPSPAGPADAARQLVPIGLQSGHTLWLVPGVHHVDANGIDDVMRGEETQIWGDTAPAGSLVVLPGTHSKWVRIDAGDTIGAFRTWMTGELYSVLCAHSILGRLMTTAVASADAFELGVRRGLEAPQLIGHLIFSTRTAGLMQRIAPEALADYLSGVLIGSEIGAASQAFGLSGPSHRAPSGQGGTPAIRLIGEPELCARYARALSLARLESILCSPGLACRGAWRIALSAGLLPGAEPVYARRAEVRATQPVALSSPLETEWRREAAERFIEQSGDGAALRALAGLRRHRSNWFSQLRAAAGSQSTLKIALGVFLGMIAAESALALMRSDMLGSVLDRIDQELGRLSDALPPGTQEPESQGLVEGLAEAPEIMSESLMEGAQALLTGVSALTGVPALTAVSELPDLGDALGNLGDSLFD